MTLPNEKRELRVLTNEERVLPGQLLGLVPPVPDDGGRGHTPLKLRPHNLVWNILGLARLSRQRQRGQAHGRARHLEPVLGFTPRCGGCSRLANEKRELRVLTNEERELPGQRSS